MPSFARALVNTGCCRELQNVLGGERKPGCNNKVFPRKHTLISKLLKVFCTGLCPDERRPLSGSARGRVLILRHV